MSVRTLPQDKPGEASDTGQTAVVIIDDHPPIREAIRQEIEQEIGMTVTAEVGSPERVSRLMKECSPDLAVLDVCFGKGSGFGLIEVLRAECPGMGILVFTVYEETVYAERALRLGASGYLMKDASMEEFEAALRQVGSGEMYLSPEMTTRVLLQMQQGDAEVAFPIDELTSRELRVFRMLGKGLTVGEIADRLGLARKTVETYRRRAKEKLGYEKTDNLELHAAQWVQAGVHSGPSSSTPHRLGAG